MCCCPRTQSPGTSSQACAAHCPHSTQALDIEPVPRAGSWNQLPKRAHWATITLGLRSGSRRHRRTVSRALSRRRTEAHGRLPYSDLTPTAHRGSAAHVRTTRRILWDPGYCAHIWCVAVLVRYTVTGMSNIAPRMLLAEGASGHGRRAGRSCRCAIVRGAPFQDHCSIGLI